MSFSIDCYIKTYLLHSPINLRLGYIYYSSYLANTKLVIKLMSKCIYVILGEQNLIVLLC